MALDSGTQLGSYEITSLLGKGGMGEVYRARDAKLKRDVAIKVLPAEFARDPERVNRFRREAEALAALNHPNIAAIYDLQEANDTLFLVLELVEGETLADRIRRGALPLEEALPIAKQIADALEAAHEKGILHRDLKPANIKVRPDGKVKVLDFGLAKMFTARADADFSNSPTLTAGLTMGGVILGTAAYMSPEQARGKNVGRQTDVWAFGCVLYEMLAGRQTFAVGETVTDTIAGVLAREPNWTALPTNTPPKIRTLLESCLRKDERRRLRDIGYARTEVEDTVSVPAATEAVSTSPVLRRKPSGFVWPAMAILFFLAAMGLLLRFVIFPASPPAAAMVRFEFQPPEGVSLTGQFRLSPDGRKFAFVGTSQNARQQIWVRSIDSLTAEPLSSTEGSGVLGSIFWSGDSQYIAYLAQKQLKKVSASGGPSQVICNLPGDEYFGAWNNNDVILLSRFDVNGGRILRVSAAGGPPAPIGQLEQSANRKEISHHFPAFLPDSRHYFYLSDNGAADIRAYIASLDSNERHVLPNIASPAQFDASGRIYFIRDNALMVQMFDEKQLEPTGDAMPIENVSAPLTTLSALGMPRDWAAGLFFSVSSNASLAYRRGERSGNYQKTELVWYDRKGTRMEVAGPMDEYRNPAVSLDGKYIAFERGNPADIWVLDIQRGVPQRLTTRMPEDLFPVWSPNGQQIVFVGVTENSSSLFLRAFGVVGQDEVLTKMAAVGPDDWSRDGKYILFDSVPPQRHIWAVPAAGSDHTPFQVTFSEFEERGGRLSPDGHWVVYGAIDQGQSQIYIQSFPQKGTKKQISANGGAIIRWRRDGKELYYLARDGVLMAVSIATTATTVDVGTPKPLFKTPILLTGATRDYDIGPDGRFLINVTNPASTNPTAASMNVTLNWRPNSRN